MFVNQLLWAAWRALLGNAPPLLCAETGTRNYSLPRLGDPENVRDPVARLERGMTTFVVTAARAASGV